VNLLRFTRVLRSYLGTPEQPANIRRTFPLPGGGDLILDLPPTPTRAQLVKAAMWLALEYEIHFGPEDLDPESTAQEIRRRARRFLRGES
jgi:hypothetical protein